MTFKPALWRPIALGLGGVNILAAGFAAASAEPIHAGVHALLAVAFGLWAEHLRRSPVPVEGGAQLDAFEAEVGELRRELGEVQERIDFAERLLARRQEPPPADHAP